MRQGPLLQCGAGELGRGETEEEKEEGGREGGRQNQEMG